MRRRTLLAACGCGVFGVSTSGCLESFRREDAWRELVVDPPEGIYVPPEVDETTAYGHEATDEYAIDVFATRPHSFWTVSDTERTRADLRSEHSIHLMASVWDEDTELVLPTDIAVSIRRNGDRVGDRRLWPMLSQRMGFHYGENVSLPEDGTYVAELTVEPVHVQRLGGFDDRFETPTTFEIEFDYSSEQIESLERTLLDADDGRGSADALEMMHDPSHDDGDTDSGDANETNHDDDRDEHPVHPPPSIAPELSSLPGTYGGVATGGDIEFAVTAGEHASERGDTYLAVSPRTAYNRCVLPFGSLSATVARDGAAVASGPLAEAIGPGLEHHYGASFDLEAFRAGDEVSVSVETPPQLARHEGYETAFFDRERAVVALEERR